MATTVITCCECESDDVSLLCDGERARLECNACGEGYEVGLCDLCTIAPGVEIIVISRQDIDHSWGSYDLLACPSCADKAEREGIGHRVAS